MVRNILYVDDELESRFLVADYLRSLGFEILTVERTREARNVAQEVRLDVIILDVNLIGEDVPALLASLIKGHPLVPIILYSGLERDAPAVQNMLALGASDFVNKNLPLDELARTIQHVLRPKR